MLGLGLWAAECVGLACDAYKRIGMYALSGMVLGLNGKMSQALNPDLILSLVIYFS